LAFFLAASVHRALAMMPPPSQVEPVRIPAGQDGDVAGDQAVAVVRACVAQQAHFGRRRLKIPAPELPGELGAAFSVPGIGILVDSPGVVEKREQFNDMLTRAGFSCEHEPVDANPYPVRNAVKAVPIDLVLTAQVFDKAGFIYD
jgi:hypothetical protein